MESTGGGTGIAGAALAGRGVGRRVVLVVGGGGMGGGGGHGCSHWGRILRPFA